MRTFVIFTSCIRGLSFVFAIFVSKNFVFYTLNNYLFASAPKFNYISYCINETKNGIIYIYSIYKNSYTENFF